MDADRRVALMPGIDITDTTITFSQSWLNTMMNCPEQARLEMVGELPRVENDATACGSAMHAGIEHVVGGGTLTEGEGVAIAKLEELVAQPNFAWVQAKTKETVVRTLQRIYWCWANEVWPQLPGTEAVEFKFDVPIAQTPTRIVRIKGAIDYVDEIGDIWDWKSAGSFRQWEQWQVDRYKIQPTVYTYAMACEHDDLTSERHFHYAVMNKAAQEHRIFSTTRGPSQWNWLADQCNAIALQVEADLPRWTPNDQSALCSPKWCTAWSKCKGAH
jgi:hypothetical protein